MAVGQLQYAEIVLNSMTTNILLLDADLTVQYANPAAQQLLLQSRRKILGTHFDSLFDYFSVNPELMLKTLQAQQGFTDNEVSLVINDEYHIATLTAQPISDELILVELTPLSNQHRLNQELLQQSQQAAARELIRGLAHEIKNPLGGLRGAAQLLEKQLSDVRLKEYTHIIIEQADRLRNLVDRLLGPQRLSEKKIQNIHQTIERVYRLLEIEKNPNITIIRDYDPSLPEFIHDSEQIEQVMLNICRNALQAIGQLPGTIIITTRTASQVTLHGQRYRLSAKITIEDNGPGIPLHLRDTLFYPMVSGRQEGSGLGLSIARTLIDQHGGKITFDSWPGHTKFNIYLPIRQ